jgi:hypothetical protein
MKQDNLFTIQLILTWWYFDTFLSRQEVGVECAGTGQDRWQAAVNMENGLRVP